MSQRGSYSLSRSSRYPPPTFTVSKGVIRELLMLTTAEPPAVEPSDPGFGLAARVGAAIRPRESVAVATESANFFTFFTAFLLKVSLAENPDQDGWAYLYSTPCGLTRTTWKTRGSHYLVSQVAVTARAVYDSCNAWPRGIDFALLSEWPPASRKRARMDTGAYSELALEPSINVVATADEVGPWMM